MLFRRIFLFLYKIYNHMTENTLLRAGLALVTVTLLALTVNYTNENSDYKKLKKDIETVKNQNDSLYQELFDIKVEAGRYELSLDHLNETNPKAAKDFEQFYNHETE